MLIQTLETQGKGQEEVRSEELSGKYTQSDLQDKARN